MELGPSIVKLIILLIIIIPISCMIIKKSKTPKENFDDTMESIKKVKRIKF